MFWGEGEFFFSGRVGLEDLLRANAAFGAYTANLEGNGSGRFAERAAVNPELTLVFANGTLSAALPDQHESGHASAGRLRLRFAQPWLERFLTNTCDVPFVRLLVLRAVDTVGCPGK